jgi:hypothetical protein
MNFTKFSFFSHEKPMQYIVLNLTSVNVVKYILDHTFFHTSYALHLSLVQLMNDVYHTSVIRLVQQVMRCASCSVLHFSEIKVVMELAKKMRHDLGATFEPAKPPEKPLAGVVKDGPVEPPPSAENNHAPQTEKMGETPRSEIAQGSCVTGGSPIGWNFLVWPGGEVVYYGRTKEVFRAGQAEN